VKPLTAGEAARDGAADWVTVFDQDRGETRAESERTWTARGTRSATSASEKKIGEEAAPSLGMILERSGDVLPRINEPSALKPSAKGQRPTH
jgi:hypothetical protein